MSDDIERELRAAALAFYQMPAREDGPTDAELMVLERDLLWRAAEHIRDLRQDVENWKDAMGEALDRSDE